MNDRNTSENICIITFIIVLLIVTFIIGPLREIFLIPFIIRLIIFSLLGYLVYITLQSIDNSNYTKMVKSSPELIHIHQRNLIYKYTFVFIVIIVFMYILKNSF